LRQQRGWHVRERDSTEKRSRCKPCGVADHAAADGDNRAAAIGARADERLVDT
jgi:hypothetical protein